MGSSKIALLGGLASTAVAHGVVSTFKADGVEHEGYQNQYLKAELAGEPIPEMAAWHSRNDDMGFVSTGDYQSPDIICHKEATAPNTTATVAAGGTVEFQWNQWVDSHMGPVYTYVANCGGDCETVDKEALEWIKIDGYDLDDAGEWATTKLIANDANWVTTVPKELVAGHYVFRHEIIAIYGKQHYPQCMSIDITGDGTENPEGIIGTELYTIENQKDGHPVGPDKWVPGSDASMSIPSPSASAVPSGTGVTSGSASASATSAESADPTGIAISSAPAVDGSYGEEIPTPSSSAQEAESPEPTSSAQPSSTEASSPQVTSSAPADEGSYSEEIPTPSSSAQESESPETTSSARPSSSEASSPTSPESSKAVTETSTTPSATLPPKDGCAIRRRHARDVRV